MDEFLPLAIQSNRLVTPPDKSQLEEVLEVDSLAYGPRWLKLITVFYRALQSWNLSVTMNTFFVKNIS